MRRPLTAFASILVSLGLTGPAPAQTSKPIEVIVFPGGFNWPIWVAQEKGFFERNNVAVKITPTPNSVFQLTNLIDGKFDIAITAIDNLIAYMEGQGEAPTTHTPDLVAVMGSDNGFLRLVSVPEAKNYADLKGKEVSVDARTTGYAFVLEKLLEKGGLKRDDVTYVKAGGVLQRFEALLAKKHAATMLISPFEVVAEARGFNRLANAVDVLGHYQGLVAGVRRQWAKENESQVVGFIRGFRAGVDWLYDPANKAEAIAILRKNLPNMAEDLANKSYGILMDPKDGFTRDASIDVEGVRTVLALRTQYGEPQKELNAPMKYIDLSYYEKAK
jgi:ABC-type nitrate/sulfonate/bicarbonate transport system substrate-binding protein